MTLKGLAYRACFLINKHLPAVFFGISIPSFIAEVFIYWNKFGLLTPFEVILFWAISVSLAFLFCLLMKKADAAIGRKIERDVQRSLAVDLNKARAMRPGEKVVEGGEGSYEKLEICGTLDALPDEAIDKLFNQRWHRK